MRVEELIELLEGCNPEAEVRFASQPSWPFEYSIETAIEVDLDGNDTGIPKDVVYLEEGSQIGYLPELAKFELSW
jgi:hypothetical protein|tara:strand:+ start:773 stop:997 length:225 start_codon:yes stop_codon:yes gene_type:complete